MTQELVAIYHRTSAADAGTSLEAQLAPLRRYVELKGWSLLGEFVDHHQRHDGPRPELERLGALVTAGTVRVVVVESLHRAFRNHRVLALTGHEWTTLGVALVSLLDDLDGTTVTGSLLQRDALRLLREFEQRRHAEATTVGILLARLAAGSGELGPWGSERRTAVHSRLEVKALYEEGHAGRYLSTRDIVRHIKKTGGSMSNGTLTKMLRELREAGMLDEQRRQELRERTGANLGGRPRVRLTYDADEIGRLLDRGYGAQRILEGAQSLPRRTNLSQVRRIMAAVRAARQSAAPEDPLRALETPARERGVPKAAEGGGGPKISPAIDARGVAQRAYQAASAYDEGLDQATGSPDPERPR